MTTMPISIPQTLSKDEYDFLSRYLNQVAIKALQKMTSIQQSSFEPIWEDLMSHIEQSQSYQSIVSKLKTI